MKIKEDYNYNPDPTVRLLFKPQTSWGTHNIPKEQWIDVKKKYTCNGYEVENLTIELHNSNGEEVTYPVNGDVIIRKKPRKTKWMIWSLSGLNNVCFPSKWNLIEKV